MLGGQTGDTGKLEEFNADEEHEDEKSILILADINLNEEDEVLDEYVSNEKSKAADNGNSIGAEGASSGSSIHEDRNTTVTEVRNKSRPVRSKKPEELFPFLADINRELRSHVQLDYPHRNLLRIMDKFIKYIKENEIIFNFPNRCLLLARNMARIMYLIKILNKELTYSHEYLLKMCKLLGTYTFLELRYASKFDSSRIVIAERIFANYNLHLKNVDISYVLRVFLNIQSFALQKEIMTRIFEKYLVTQIFTKEELPDSLYVLYLVTYNRWKNLENDPCEKDRIIGYANSFMKPKRTLRFNPCFAPFIPKFEAQDENATESILSQRFNSKQLILALKDEEEIESRGDYGLGGRANFKKNEKQNRKTTVVEIIDLDSDDSNPAIVLQDKPQTNSEIEIVDTIDLTSEDETRPQNSCWLKYLIDNAKGAKSNTLITINLADDEDEEAENDSENISNRNNDVVMTNKDVEVEKSKEDEVHTSLENNSVTSENVMISEHNSTINNNSENSLLDVELQPKEKLPLDNCGENEAPDSRAMGTESNENTAQQKREENKVPESLSRVKESDENYSERELKSKPLNNENLFEFNHNVARDNVEEVFSENVSFVSSVENILPHGRLEIAKSVSVSATSDNNQESTLNMDIDPVEEILLSSNHEQDTNECMSTELGQQIDPLTMVIPNETDVMLNSNTKDCISKDDNKEINTSYEKRIEVTDKIAPLSCPEMKSFDVQKESVIAAREIIEAEINTLSSQEILSVEQTKQPQTNLVKSDKVICTKSNISSTKIKGDQGNNDASNGILNPSAEDKNVSSLCKLFVANENQAKLESINNNELEKLLGNDKENEMNFLSENVFPPQNSGNESPTQYLFRDVSEAENNSGDDMLTTLKDLGYSSNLSTTEYPRKSALKVYAGKRKPICNDSIINPSEELTKENIELDEATFSSYESDNSMTFSILEDSENNDSPKAEYDDTPIDRISPTKDYFTPKQRENQLLTPMFNFSSSRRYSGESIAASQDGDRIFIDGILPSIKDTAKSEDSGNIVFSTPALTKKLNLPPESIDDVNVVGEEMEKLENISQNVVFSVSKSVMPLRQLLPKTSDSNKTSSGGFPSISQVFVNLDIIEKKQSSIAADDNFVPEGENESDEETEEIKSPPLEGELEADADEFVDLLDRNKELLQSDASLVEEINTKVIEENLQGPSIYRSHVNKDNSTFDNPTSIQKQRKAVKFAEIIEQKSLPSSVISRSKNFVDSTILERQIYDTNNSALGTFNSSKRTNSVTLQLKSIQHQLNESEYFGKNLKGSPPKFAFNFSNQHMKNHQEQFENYLKQDGNLLCPSSNSSINNINSDVRDSTTFSSIKSITTVTETSPIEAATGPLTSGRPKDTGFSSRDVCASPDLSEHRYNKSRVRIKSPPIGILKGPRYGSSDVEGFAEQTKNSDKERLKYRSIFSSEEEFEKESTDQEDDESGTDFYNENENTSSANTDEEDESSASARTSPSLSSPLIEYEKPLNIKPVKTEYLSDFDRYLEEIKKKEIISNINTNSSSALVRNNFNKVNYLSGNVGINNILPISGNLRNINSNNILLSSPSKLSFNSSYNNHKNILKNDNYLGNYSELPFWLEENSNENSNENSKNRKSRNRVRKEVSRTGKKKGNSKSINIKNVFGPIETKRNRSRSSNLNSGRDSSSSRSISVSRNKRTRKFRRKLTEKEIRDSFNDKKLKKKPVVVLVQCSLSNSLEDASKKTLFSSCENDLQFSAEDRANTSASLINENEVQIVENNTHLDCISPVINNFCVENKTTSDEESKDKINDSSLSPTKSLPSNEISGSCSNSPSTDTQYSKNIISNLNCANVIEEDKQENISKVKENDESIPAVKEKLHSRSPKHEKKRKRKRTDPDKIKSVKTLRFRSRNDVIPPRIIIRVFENKMQNYGSKKINPIVILKRLKNITTFTVNKDGNQQQIKHGKKIGNQGRKTLSAVIGSLLKEKEKRKNISNVELSNEIDDKEERPSESNKYAERTEPEEIPVIPEIENSAIEVNSCNSQEMQPTSKEDAIIDREQEMVTHNTNVEVHKENQNNRETENIESIIPPIIDNCKINHKVNVNNHEVDVNNHEVNVNNHEVNVNNHEVNDNNHEVDVNNHEVNVNNHEVNDNSHEANVNNHEVNDTNNTVNVNNYDVNDKDEREEENNQSIDDNEEDIRNVEQRPPSTILSNEIRSNNRRTSESKSIKKKTTRRITFSEEENNQKDQETTDNSKETTQSTSEVRMKSEATSTAQAYCNNSTQDLDKDATRNQAQPPQQEQQRSLETCSFPNVSFEKPYEAVTYNKTDNLSSNSEAISAQNLDPADNEIRSRLFEGFVHDNEVTSTQGFNSPSDADSSYIIPHSDDLNAGGRSLQQPSSSSCVEGDNSVQNDEIDTSNMTAIKLRGRRKTASQCSEPQNTCVVNKRQIEVTNCSSEALNKKAKTVNNDNVDSSSKFLDILSRDEISNVEPTTTTTNVVAKPKRGRPKGSKSKRTKMAEARNSILRNERSNEVNFNNGVVNVKKGYTKILSATETLLSVQALPNQSNFSPPISVSQPPQSKKRKQEVNRNSACYDFIIPGGNSSGMQNNSSNNMNSSFSPLITNGVSPSVAPPSENPSLIPYVAQNLHPFENVNNNTNINAINTTGFINASTSDSQNFKGGSNNVPKDTNRANSSEIGLNSETIKTYSKSNLNQIPNIYVAPEVEKLLKLVGTGADPKSKGNEEKINNNDRDSSEDSNRLWHLSDYFQENDLTDADLKYIAHYNLEALLQQLMTHSFHR